MKILAKMSVYPQNNAQQALGIIQFEDLPPIHIQLTSLSVLGSQRSALFMSAEVEGECIELTCPLTDKYVDCHVTLGQILHQVKPAFVEHILMPMVVAMCLKMNVPVPNLFDLRDPGTLQQMTQLGNAL